MQKSQQAWVDSTEVLCDYNNKSGGSMDRIGYANCVTSAWKNRAKNIKADARVFKVNPTLSAEQQEKVKNSYLSNDKSLDQKVQKVYTI